MNDKSPVIQEELKLNEIPQTLSSTSQKNRKRTLSTDSSSSFSNVNPVPSPSSHPIKKSKKDLGISIQSIVPSIVAPPPLLPSQMNLQSNTEKHMDPMIDELTNFSSSTTENRFSLIGPDVRIFFF